MIVRRTKSKMERVLWTQGWPDAIATLADHSRAPRCLCPGKSRLCPGKHRPARPGSKQPVGKQPRAIVAARVTM
jgi:hypothetical protein